jgi:uncharacterized protein YecT (DUF1311 family)
MINTLEQTPANQAKLAQAQRAWNEVLVATLERGFFGSASVEITIQDGTIQNIRRRMERMER